ncbi:MAG: polymer-forming cytoskeletal protein [Candidatus Yanofskybacteria bacterium]|nr:polymer-forming cytoskeletal protein [Candidatus Yanofskybacteria bacterium]
MKRSLGLLAVAVLAAFPLSTSAATLVSGQQYALPAQQRVSGSLYIAAGTATVGGTVDGDVLSVGGTVSVTGAVLGDVAAIGGNVQILGPVSGDARIAGGSIVLNDRIAGDLVVAGGSIHLLPSARVGGDLVIAGGQVVIDGAVDGNVRMIGGVLVVNGTINGDVSVRADESVTLGSSAVIGGDLTYRSRQELQRADGARISGSVAYTPAPKGVRFDDRTPKRIGWAIVGVLSAMKLFATLGLAAFLMWRWRRQMLALFAQTHEAFTRSLGRGIIYGVMVPIVAVLLLVSFIGVLPGVLLIMAYASMLILAKALAGMFFGSWIVMHFQKKTTLQLTWVSALGGVILFGLVGVIPVIGWLVGAVLYLAVLGMLAHEVFQWATGN